VRNLIAQIPGIKDPDLSWSAGKPEMQVRVDREKATSLGISLAEIAAVLRTAYEGDTSAKFREAGQEYDIRVRVRPDQRQRLGDLNDLVVGYVQGAPVYLRDVASISLGEGPTKIERTDRQRRITVTANLLPGYHTRQHAPELSMRSWREANAIPPGVRVSWFGENEVLAREGVYMAQALLLALILVYLLMVALFENWLYPFIIMFSQPQALVGALLAFILFRSELNIISMIGIIALVGIVGKNAILLVDYTNTLRQRGLPRDEALLEVGRDAPAPNPDDDAVTGVGDDPDCVGGRTWLGVPRAAGHRAAGRVDGQHAADAHRHSVYLHGDGRCDALAGQADLAARCCARRNGSGGTCRARGGRGRPASIRGRPP
jgi:HAE1 family hydrophobic/amphiphilic exporter-1